MRKFPLTRRAASRYTTLSDLGFRIRQETRTNVRESADSGTATWRPFRPDTELVTTPGHGVRRLPSDLQWSSYVNIIPLCSRDANTLTNLD